MKKIGVITNYDRDRDLSYTREIIHFLNQKGCRVLINHIVGKRLGVRDVFSSDTEIYAKAEVLIVLGGDGTILRVAKHAAVYGVPIFGINLGNLGYLAGADKADGIMETDKMLRGDYIIEKRMMLEAEVGEQEKLLCLNDMYVRNKEAAHIIKVSVWVNGIYIDTYKGDGLIIASPTGSTAYNLSAGGPVLKPDTSLMVITQICPHNLYARPLVISGDDEVTIAAADDGQNAVLIADGQKCAELKRECGIKIKKAEYYTKIIKTTDLGFYDILRRKMVEIK